MALGAVLAAALNTAAAHRWTLTVAGLDVTRDPAGAFGTLVESVRIVKAAPGNVSDMSFDVDDPSLSWTPNVGDAVVLWDNVADRPLFAGYVLTPARATLGIGRTWHVDAIGAEAILDWSILGTDVIVAAGTLLRDAVLQVCGSVLWGAPGVRVFANANALANPTQAMPVGGFGNWTPSLSAPFTLTAGTTLRAALRTMGDKWRAGFNDSGVFVPTFTVDEWLGLRGFVAIPPSFLYDQPTDYATLTVSATPAAVTPPAGLQDTVDGGATIRGYLVTGTGTSGPVGDGTGLPGPWATIDDSSITTDVQRLATARSRMAARTNVHRGSFRLEDWAPGAYYPPGTLVTITDSTIGITGTWFVGGVTIGLHGSGRQDWDVAFGADPPSEITVTAWTR